MMHAAHISALLFDLFEPAELAQGCVSGFLWGDPSYDLLLNESF